MKFQRFNLWEKYGRGWQLDIGPLRLHWWNGTPPNYKHQWWGLRVTCKFDIPWGWLQRKLNER